MKQEIKVLEVSELLNAPWEGYRINSVFPMIKSRDLTIAKKLLKPFATEDIVEGEHLYNMIKMDLQYYDEVYYGDSNAPSDARIYGCIYRCATICHKGDLEICYVISRDLEYGFLFTEVLYDNRTGLFYDVIVEDNYSSEFIYLSSTYELF